MKSCYQRTIFSSFVLLIWALPIVSQGDEPASPGKYKVYGGNCSRSIRLLASFDDPLMACSLAEARRADDVRHVSVVTGEAGYALSPMGNDRLKSCSIYERQCKAFQWTATTARFREAKLIIDQIESEQSSAEVIYHFPTAADVAGS